MAKRDSNDDVQLRPRDRAPGPSTTSPEPVAEAGTLPGVAERAAGPMSTGSGEEYPDRAAAEVPPREVEAGRVGAPGVGAVRPGAVDANRPADVVNQAGIGDTRDLTGPRMSPNVLQRQNVIVPQDRIHPETAGEALAEEESEELERHRGTPV